MRRELLAVLLGACVLALVVQESGPPGDAGPAVRPGPRPLPNAQAGFHARARPDPLPAARAAMRGLDEDEEGAKGEPTPEAHARALAAVEALNVLPALGVNTALGEWRNVGPGNLGGKAYAVAVNPFDSANVFAAFEIGGLWRTRNGGDTWTPMHDFFRDMSYASVKVHPAAGNVVAAGLIGVGRGYDTSLNRDWGVLLSQDGGDHWTAIGPRTMNAACRAALGSMRPTVWDIAFDPANAALIYAATDCGVYKTLDSGANWELVLAYAPPQPPAPADSGGFQSAVSMVMSPANPAVLLLGVNSLGIMRTSNGGRTWARVDNTVSPPAVDPPHADSPILAWSASEPRYVYLQVTSDQAEPRKILTFQSRDGGKTWSKAAEFEQFQQGRYDMAMAVDPANSQRVLIANSYHAVSDDGLANIRDALYQPIGRLASGPDSLGLVFDPQNPAVAYNATDEGIFRSDDSGVTWRRFDGGTLTNKAVGMAVAGDGAIFVDSKDYITRIGFTKVYGWRVVRGGYEYNHSHVNPHDPSDIYDMGSDGLYRVGNGLDGEPVQIDPDPSQSRNYGAVAFAPDDARTLYVATRDLWRSTDLGANWEVIGVNATAAGHGPMRDIKVAPGDGTHLYALAGDGTLWSSRNGGVNWNAGFQHDGADVIAIHPGNHTRGYLATSYDGLYRLSNSGASAQKVTEYPYAAVVDIVIDPLAPTHLFAATSTGVLVSLNDGAVWKRLGAGMPPLPVTHLQLVGRTLYAATAASIFALDLAAGPGCAQPSSTVPAGLSAGSVTGYNRQQIEVFAVDGCPWTATSDAGWVRIDTGVDPTSGHRVIFAQPNAFTGEHTRRTTLTVAGQRLPFYQFGTQTQVRNALGCLSVADDGRLSMAVCNSNDVHQKMWLFENYLGGFSIGPTFANHCLAVAERTIGTRVIVQGCDYSEHQQSFQVLQVAPGQWSLLTPHEWCVDSAGGVLRQRACRFSGTQRFRID